MKYTKYSLTRITYENKIKNEIEIKINLITLIKGEKNFFTLFRTSRTQDKTIYEY